MVSCCCFELLGSGRVVCHAVTAAQAAEGVTDGSAGCRGWVRVRVRVRSSSHAKEPLCNQRRTVGKLAWPTAGCLPLSAVVMQGRNRPQRPPACPCSCILSLGWWCHRPPGDTQARTPGIVPDSFPSLPQLSSLSLHSAELTLEIASDGVPGCPCIPQGSGWTSPS